MGITEVELREAYENDVTLQAAVLSNQMDGYTWRMNRWYAVRLGYVCPNRLEVPVNCLMVLLYRIEVFKLMLEHGRIAVSHISKTFIAALESQAESLGVLERENPAEFREYDQQFMLGHVPEHLSERYRNGALPCEELMRFNPKFFLPLVPYK